MGRTKWIITVSVLVAIIGGGVGWAVFGREDSELAELRKQRNALAETIQSDDEDESEESRDERRQLLTKLREQVEQLPPEKREQFEQESRKMFIGIMQQRIIAFFELPPEEQTERLDELIDRMERGRKEREARQRQAATSSDAGNGQAAEGNSERRPGGRPDFSKMTQEERNEFRKRMLDHTTPEGRARFTEFRRMLNERREERGLPEMQGFWR